ncbi:enoyl-CoA hydratase [Paenibacillus melissococcoides]|uniref:Enoyl-CoA hydratase n=1 Tax=Paenibacillus melissococcoides TaxID=2912268 RepID=A0ABN8U7R3_9BACL|nr:MULTISPECIES: enoyl-CoA hydratase [Paenibacillus]MEB9893498.1 enoyl-CoA hydratase [Bacillus cereus]CAH8246428.1 enoyl-CoA hydratase [Paenibacillus melissococcoides]CAH8714715.1 enoyl-CoA hydratase [Paenibacillus melissococcoides]CAH8715671.1 enoyl-CoA hydratase [Paenibacillus melissococcoides]GIO81303.1 putative enoyl-CoA hydratase/isomerase YngF [Paenibacillus dendritiformis]
MEKAVLVSSMGNGIVLMTLNRPEAANALSIKMLEQLRDAVATCKFDRSVRCIVVTGAGEKAFCAGADLKERAGMDMNRVRRTVSLIRQSINDLEALPQPVIAAVNGAALGGGMELALACDIRIASETATFALTETSLGIIPGAGGTQRLPRLIGKGRAKELIFTARKIGAKEARDMGVVEYVAPLESLLDKALEIAGQIVRNAPIAVAEAKFAIDKGCDADLSTGLAIEQNAYEVTIPTKDRLEGLQAFKDKRPPIFKGE